MVITTTNNTKCSYCEKAATAIRIVRIGTNGDHYVNVCEKHKV